LSYLKGLRNNISKHCNRTTDQVETNKRLYQKGSTGKEVSNIVVDRQQSNNLRHV